MSKLVGLSECEDLTSGLRLPAHLGSEVQVESTRVRVFSGERRLATSLIAKLISQMGSLVRL